MRHGAFSFGLAALLPFAVAAQGGAGYRCTTGDLVRRVEIVHETGDAVPCEVHYYKDTEEPGRLQVLWQALNEAGYCEARARDFVAGLEDMGWRCTGPAAEAARDDRNVPEAVESDDRSG